MSLDVSGHQANPRNQGAQLGGADANMLGFASEMIVLLAFLVSRRQQIA